MNTDGTRINSKNPDPIRVPSVFHPWLSFPPHQAPIALAIAWAISIVPTADGSFRSAFMS